MKKNSTLFLMLLLVCCSYAQLPLETFEGIWNTNDGTDQGPPGWKVLNNGIGPAKKWVQVPHGLATPSYEGIPGTHAAYINKETVSGGIAEDYLVTPQFSVPLIAPQLKFMSRLTTIQEDGGIYKIMVLNLTDNPGADENNIASYTTLVTWNTEAELNPVALEYALKTIVIPDSYIGDTIRLAFVMGGNDADRWLIDHVEVVQKCFEPDLLQANNITINSAALNWNNPGNAAKWEIELVYDTEIPTGSGVIYDGTLPYLVTGLETEQCYKYYVRTICPNGNKSGWVGAFNFCTKGIGDNCAEPIMINSLPYSDVDNTINFGNDYHGIPGNNCGDETWYDYLSGNDVVYKYTADFTGTIDIDLTDNDPNSGVFIYDECNTIGIDCIGGGTAGATGHDIYIEDFPVINGEDYYIVISTFNANVTPYMLTIQATACEEPQGLPVENPGLTSALLSWTNPTAATSWEIVVQEPGPGVPTGPGTLVQNDPNFSPNNLLPSTIYEYWVRSDCGNGSYSVWAGPFRFNTMACEPADQCTLTFTMWGQGNSTWNNHTMNVIQNGIVVAVLTGPSAWGTGTVTQDVQLCDGLPVQLAWNASGNWAGTVGISISNSFNQTLYTKNPGSGTPGTVLYIGTVECNIPLCLPPTNLTAQNPTLNTIDLSWLGPESVSWEYYIVEAGDPAPGADIPGILTTTNFVTGAALPYPATEYDFYVRMLCDGDSKSAWAGPVEFSSKVCSSENQCNYTFILKSNSATGWQSGYMTISQNEVTIAVIGPGFNPGEETMEITLPVCNDKPLEIFWDNAGYGGSDIIGLEVYNSFEQPVFNLPYNSDGVGTFIYDEANDCNTPLCIPPTGLTVSNATLTTVDLGWDGPPTGAWEYYIAEADAPAPTSATIGVITTSNPTLEAGALQQAMEYKYYVRILCNGEDKSEWAGPFTFISSVCAPEEKCNYTFVMKSGWFSGWEGGLMTIRQNDLAIDVIGPEFTDGGSMEVVVPLCNNIPFEVYWNQGGDSAGQIGLDIINSFDQTIYSLPIFNDGFNVGSIIYQNTADCLLPECLPPTGLYTQNETMTATDLGWDGPDTGQWEYFIIEEDETAPGDATAGTPTSTNPTTGVVLENPGTNYKFYVRQYCPDISEFSKWAGPFAFNSEVCDQNNKCTYTFELTHEDGFGYLNNEMIITQGGTPVASLGLDFVSGTSMTVEVALCPDVPIDVTWIEGGAPNGVGFKIITPYGEDQYTMPDFAVPGLIYSGSPTCDALTCSKPQDVTASDITMNSVTLGWTETGDATQWEVFLLNHGEPGPAADAEGIIANTNPFTLTTGVEPGINYDFYVRAVCGGDDKSLWIGPNKFQSLQCPAENQCAYTFIMSSTYTSGDGWQGDTMQIIQGGVIITTLTGPVDENDNEDIEQTVYLCSGIPFSVKWVNTNGAFSSQYIGLKIVDNYTDEVLFTVFPGSGNDIAGTVIYAAMAYCSEITCPWPTELASEGYDSTSVLLDWEPAGNETQWDVYIQQGGGFYPQPDTEPAATVTDSNYHAQNLTQGIFYEYYVRAVCAEDNKSYWYGPFAFSIFMPSGCSVEIYDPENPDPIANGQEYILCPGEDVCIPLSAKYIKTGASTEYTVEQIDYQPPYPFTGGTPLNVQTDDIWSPVVHLPFNFCFYGEMYDKCLVGSNGVITFNTSDPGGFCPYDFTGDIPQQEFPILNAIYGPYQDIHPPTVNDFALGDVNYQVLGTYPCRALVVNYNKVSQYDCYNNPAVGAQTSQIVLYEVTNTIEIYVERRVACNNWHSGVGVIGIQNSDGTQAAVPDGFNTGNWEAHKEAFRFIPSGEPNFDFKWIHVINDEEVVLSNQDAIEFCTNQPSTLIAQATYANCDGESYTKESVIVVKAAEPIIAGEADNIATCTSSAEAAVNLAEAVEGVADPLVYNFTFYSTEEAATSGNNDNIAAEFTAAPGTYTLWVRVERNNEPCFVLRSFNVIINGIKADEPGDVTGCDAYMLPELQDGSYFTQPGGQGIELHAGELITATQTIYVYNETGTDPNCSSEHSFVVTILPTPKFSLGGPYMLCDAANAVISVTAENFAIGDAAFTWKVNNEVAAETGSTIDGTVFGNYEVTVTVGDCSSSLSVELKENTTNVAVAIIDLCENNVYKLQANEVEGSFDPDTANYHWTGPDFTATGQIVEVTAQGAYTVTVTNNDNCGGTATFNVLSTRCFIQRGISPNGDGDNEFFDLETMNVSNLKIFNRYGQEVYHRSPYTNQWHGQTNKGDELPSGTYFYVITTLSSEQITGWIYINR